MIGEAEKGRQGILNICIPNVAKHSMNEMQKEITQEKSKQANSNQYNMKNQLNWDQTKR